MKADLSKMTNRFAQRTIMDFSKNMIDMLQDMKLEEITVKQICDKCNYPRSTFYNYFYDIYDLMDSCWVEVMKDMGIDKYLNAQGEKNTEEIFCILYEYLEQYKIQINRILSHNNLDGRCISSLRNFIRKQIAKTMSLCSKTMEFPICKDVMIDYYADIIEMLLEKCFSTNNKLSKDDALKAIKFLIGTVEKEVCKK